MTQFMKLLGLAAGLLAAEGRATISLVTTPARNSLTSPSTSNSVTITGTTSGSAIVVILWGSQASAYSWSGCTDNKGGGSSLYTKAIDRAQSNRSSSSVAIYYALNAAPGISQVTCTTSASCYCGMSVWELANISTSSALDQTSGNDAGSVGDTIQPYQCGSITTTNAADIIIAAVSHEGGSNPFTLTPDSGYTVPTNGYEPNGSCCGQGGGQYRVYNARGTYSPTFGAPGSAQYTCVIASFKEAGDSGGGGGGSAVRRRLIN